ncbi:MAG: TolC family protein [Acidobacteriaceae bacterium]|nr:TolC family protein [Acidobacteriaceae bacterium]MBV9441979.1 TolC family protein [Acidobacteriaceae bacterium]
MKAALTARPDYRSAEANVNAAELHVRSIKATRLPTVQARLSDGQSGSTPTHNVNTYALGGSIEFPIFTGGRIRGEIQEAEGALREAQAALDANRSQIEADVQAAVSGVQWAVQELETSGGNLNLSRQELDLTRERFAQGICDNTEVVNAQERLEQSADARIRAQYTLGLARANLARATGTAEKTYRK